MNYAMMPGEGRLGTDTDSNCKDRAFKGQKLKITFNIRLFSSEDLENDLHSHNCLSI